MEEKRLGQAEEPIFPIITFKDCLDSFSEQEPISDFYSSAVKRITVALKSTRLVNFPKFLVFSMRLFNLDAGWVPKKLDVEVDVPEEIDLTWLKSNGPQPTEVLLSDEEGPKEPAFKEEDVAIITTMGFTINQAHRALYATKGQPVDLAIAWIMEHMDDPDINLPLPSANNKKQSASVNISPENIQTIQFMGFTEAQAKKALKNTSNNVERAMDWIFNHPDDTGQEEEEPKTDNKPKTELSDGSGVYELYGFINHIGPSTLSGHYICHIKKDGKWVKFNDDKVEESLNPPKQFGYLYFFKRKDN